MTRLLAAAALLVLGCGAVFAAPSSPGAPEVVTSSEYVRQLDDVAARLHEAGRAGKSGAAQATRALSALPSRLRADGVSVDNGPLLKELREEMGAGPRGIARAEEEVRGLREAVASRQVAAPAEARGVLTEVLQRPEFTESWWQKLRTRIALAVSRVVEKWLDALGRHFPSLGGHAAWLLPVLYWVLLVAAGAAALYLLYIVSQVVAARYGREDRLAPPPAPAAEVIRSSREWLAEAERQAQAGDHRAAVRALYMAALMRLDETGHLSYESFHTDGWFVRALQARGQAELAGALSPLARLFSAAWYGSASAGPAESGTAQQCWRQVEALAL